MLQQLVLHPAAHRGVIAVARQVEQRGHEAPVVVLAQEELDPTTLLQLQDLPGHILDLRDLHLQQLIARIGLQDLHQVIAGMRVRAEAGTGQQLLGTGAQQRNGGNGLGVGPLAEQSEESPFTDDITSFVEGLHRHIVHIGTTPHRGAGIGFGNHQRLRLAGAFTTCRRELRGTLGARSAVYVGEDPQASAGQRLKAQRVLVIDQLVLAVAQEEEVTLTHPLQQFGRLITVFHIAELTDISGRPAGLGDHPILVAVGDAHIVEHPGQALDESLALLLADDPVNLYGNPGFHLGFVVLIEDLSQRRQRLGIAGGERTPLGGQGFDALEALILQAARGQEDGVDHQRDGMTAASDL